MTQNRQTVPDVPDVVPGLCRHFHSCAGCAGYLLVRTRNAKRKTHRHTKTRSHAPVYTRHIRHIRHIVDSYTHLRHTPGTTSGTSGTNTSRAQTPLHISPKKKDMKQTQTPGQAKPSARCAPQGSATHQTNGLDTMHAQNAPQAK